MLDYWGGIFSFLCPHHGFNVGYTPRKAAVDTQGTNGAILAASPYTQSLRLAVQVVGGLRSWYCRAGYGFQRWELWGCDAFHVSPFGFVENGVHHRLGAILPCKSPLSPKVGYTYSARSAISPFLRKRSHALSKTVVPAHRPLLPSAFLISAFTPGLSFA